MPREESSTPRKRLPVTLISGFLGAGKSTLLRNILEAKKGDGGDFRCAVLVNDMAELNIDKSLIEYSGLVRSDEVISMQNGCVCCNLSGDLIEQIVSLATDRETQFDYLIIEASGVSEPAAIAALFEECQDDDHEDRDHGQPHATTLFEVARMDTIVTVVDSAEFLQNLDLMDDPDKRSYPRLLVEQVECSNVVLLNKTDLVSPSQLREVREKVSLLAAGRNTKIVATENSAIDAADVVGTKLYDSGDFDLSSFVRSFESESSNPSKPCCKASVAKGESPCCRRARTIDSGKSQVLLPPKKAQNTRHQENYSITSFVYKARRPFHAHGLYDKFIDKFFLREDEPDEEEEDEEQEEEETEDGDEATEDCNHDEEVHSHKKMSKLGSNDQEETEAKAQQQLETVRRMQEEGARKKKLRAEAIGSVLRMKGYLWQSNSHDLIGYVSTAGNLSRVESPGRWNCLQADSYKGTPEQVQKIREDWVAPYGDRRQELVFIGRDLKHQAIQKVLDDCLLSDETMALGVDVWKATMGDVLLDG